MLFLFLTIICVTNFYSNKYGFVKDKAEVIIMLKSRRCKHIYLNLIAIFIMLG